MFSSPCRTRALRELLAEVCPPKVCIGVALAGACIVHVLTARTTD